MSAREDYPVTVFLTDISERRYNAMADEIDRLRAALACDTVRSACPDIAVEE